MAVFRDDVFHVVDRIKFCLLARLNNRIKRRRNIGTVDRLRTIEVLSSEHGLPERALGRVVREWQPSVVLKRRKFFPCAQHVMDRLAKIVL